MKFVFHVIGNPYIPTDPKYSIDAYSYVIVKFCKLFTERGHIVHFYGVSECKNFVKCTKYHDVVKLSDYSELNKITNGFIDPDYIMSGSDLQLQTSGLLIKIEQKFVDKIVENCKSGDIIIHCFDSLFIDGMINVKISAMGGWWTCYKYVTFVTDSYMNHELETNLSPLIKSVIYPWFHLEDFLFSDKKNKNTYLYLARCQKIKGIMYFLNFSQIFKNYTFWIAGGCKNYNQIENIIDIGDIKIYLNNYPNVKYWGVVSGEIRRKLLSEATALIQPTPYFEPCGLNVLEAMISGTPVLVPHFGGFIDTVVDGITGYLCKPNEWIDKIEKVKELSPYACRNHVLNKFNENIAYNQYCKFFEEVFRFDENCAKNQLS